MKSLLARLGHWLVLRCDPTPPQFWVGVTAYEGESETEAGVAFKAMQEQQHTLPGVREWMNGTAHVRKFTVV